jgi:hypothetical protein
VSIDFASSSISNQLDDAPSDELESGAYSRAQKLLQHLADTDSTGCVKPMTTFLISRTFWSLSGHGLPVVTTHLSPSALPAAPRSSAYSLPGYWRADWRAPEDDLPPGCPEPRKRVDALPSLQSVSP